MNINNKLTAALMALGLVSAASVAKATNTFTDTANLGGLGAGTVYQVVYITGSTAFRQFEEIALSSNAGPAAGGVFDAGTLSLTQGTPPNASSIAFWGKIGGHPYIIDLNLTGSEAGIAALKGATTITYAQFGNAVAGAPNPATLAGTPNPVAFINPATGGATLTASADLAFADTSQAVSLTTTFTPTDYGIVAVIPFQWMKGNYTAPISQSWTDLKNVTTPQMIYLMPAGKLSASFFTGVGADTQSVFLIGRNEGSGTRVNTTLIAGYPSPSKFTQYVAPTASYVGGVLTAAAPAPLPAAGLKTVGQGYEGYESGSGVAKDLECDTRAASLITVGYIGIPDSVTAAGGGAVALTLNGLPENDQNVINGTYPFWGHEHLYGTPGLVTGNPGDVVAQVLIGGVVNQGIGGSWTATTGSLEQAFQNPPSGGNQANLTLQSFAVDAALMNCDKPSDSGFPSQ
jgi:hypothetical protein